MSRLIDAERFDVVTDTIPEGMDMESYVAGQQSILNMIYDAPTVEETIRCEDCKWFDRTELSGTVEPICFKCKRKQRFVEADDFCKFGKRREKE